MNIEFTDRYGGRPPSWLRGHFECEAMGVRIRVPYGPDGTIAADTPIDEWEFYQCPECKGTGRVPWCVSVARVPRWLVKGGRFVWQMGIVRNRECRPPDWSWWREFWLAVKCAYLYDLKRLRV